MALQINKVLISDAVDASCREILEGAGVAVDYKPGLSKEDLLQCIKEYDGLIVRSATKVTAEVIAAGSRLKMIGRAGTGVDNIDLEAATKHGIIVMNTPGGNTISAAEYTCTLMCSLARNVPQGYATMKAGRWDRKKFMGVELCGKTLAIVGLGRIGREVAGRMQAFGMRTIGYDPIVSAEEAAQFKVEYLELKDIWPIADFVTVHTPLIPATRGLMNDKVFSECKKGIRVINVARGGIIDEGALLRALESGQCGGAGLDVFTEEPPKEWALVDHPNVVATPHLGASTVEAQLKVAQEIAQSFVDARAGKPLFGIVNVPELSNALNPDSSPWVALTSRLAQLLQAISTNNIKSIKLCLTGPNMKGRSRFLTSAALVGCLDNANLVNARSLGRAAGVEVTVCLCEGAEGVSLSCVGGVSVCGTVLGGAPVLTGLNDVTFNLVSLSGTLVITKATTLVDLIPKLSQINSVTQSGDVIVANVSAAPKTTPPGCLATVTLNC
ncbi:D-3-phosphoglycerate dehydrogenase-like [Halichondria panicea]|uniref:D-3-phosphoglycerate dehydrogenase-like n=1 Tax=Halichondria panicea TaxID=6063 RepID=UPI00312B68B7